MTNIDKKNRLLFINKMDVSFTRTDEEIINKSFRIKKILYSNWRGLSFFKNCIVQFLQIPFYMVKSSVVYIWFADYHSILPIFFARLFKKKSIIIIGGYDVIYLPEIQYGALKNPIRAFCAKYSIKNSTICLPDCDNLTKEVINLVPAASVKTLYTGFKETIFKSVNKKKENLVITVASGKTMQRILLKGVDKFVEVAKYLPELQFVLIGAVDDKMGFYKNLPSNVTITGRVSDNELIKYYQRAKVYTQFSMREGLPSALCEAMLCECVPVGFNNGGIPIAIGDAGYIVTNNDIQSAKEMIVSAIKNYDNIAHQSRKRVIANFSFNKREHELTKIFMDII